MTRTVASRCADAAGCRLPAWRGWSRSFPRRLRVPAPAAAPGLPRNGARVRWSSARPRSLASEAQEGGGRRRDGAPWRAASRASRSSPVPRRMGEVLLDELLQCQRAANALCRRRCSSARSSASAASRSEEKPPRCRRLEPGPPVRYRYAHCITDHPFGIQRPGRPGRGSDLGSQPNVQSTMTFSRALLRTASS